jgi:cation:H+ antiporter
MEFLNFQSYPIGMNAAVSAGAAVFVSTPGSKLSRYTDQIARKTGIAHVAIGMIVLGGMSSLLEVAVPLTSSITLGGTAAQLGIGAWSWALLALYAFSVWNISHSRDHQGWVPANTENQINTNEQAAQQAQSESMQQLEHAPLKTIIVRAAAAGATILISGFVVSQTGDAIAEQTGLGQSVVGAALLGMLVTTLFLFGLVERRNQTIAGMGIDSCAVLISYLGGLFMLYQLR